MKGIHCLPPGNSLHVDIYNNVSGKYQAVGRFVTNRELLQSPVPRVGYYPHRKIKTSMSTYA